VALRRQRDQHLTLVLARARALDEMGGLEPLQKRRQRAGIEEQFFADVPQRHVVTLPQHQHHQILRIGQAEPVQQRLVDAVEGVRGGIDRKADLVVEAKRVHRR